MTEKTKKTTLAILKHQAKYFEETFVKASKAFIDGDDPQLVASLFEIKGIYEALDNWVTNVIEAE